MTKSAHASGVHMFDTRRFRLKWSALGGVLWVATCALAFAHATFLSGIALGLTAAWMVSVFAIMGRGLWERHRANRDYWDDLFDELHRIEEESP